MGKTSHLRVLGYGQGNRSKLMRHVFRSGMLAFVALIAMFSATSPRPAVAGPPIGINVSPVTDYLADIYFANAVMQARRWNNTIQDANGWPTTDAKIGMWYGA